MEKSKGMSAWTEEGYNLFAKEGLDGIQVERLARILQLNKSGFYHYFGDLEVFSVELLKLHERKAEDFLAELVQVKSIDPEYLEMIVKYRVTMMFHIHLIRDKSNPAFARIVEMIDQKEDMILGKVWSDYIGFQDSPALALRYFNIVRDMFYSRMSFQTISYSYLQAMMSEAKELMSQIVKTSTLQNDKSIF
jgi:AcrR family transcriptional regulator